MILRLASQPADPDQANVSMWDAFASTQQPGQEHSGCVTQPAHARLAGQIAALLTPDAFGALPPELIDCIGAHDRGWAMADLCALERADTTAPTSFLTLPAAQSVPAWQESIHLAHQRSHLSGIVTSRHFCLLAPQDSDPRHETFLREETGRRADWEQASPFSDDQLARFTAALGFADLLSLYLCSGSNGTVRMPLWHAADRAAPSRPHVTVTVSNQQISLEPGLLPPNSSVQTTAWIRTNQGALTPQALVWSFT